jgi:hypothetical protein
MPACEICNRIADKDSTKRWGNGLIRRDENGGGQNARATITAGPLHGYGLEVPDGLDVSYRFSGNNPTKDLPQSR